MPTIADVLSHLEEVAPTRFAFSFDKVGLQIGEASAQVTKAVVSLDRSMAAAQFAATEGAQLLLCHHPLIWDPLTAVTDSTYQGKTALFLIRKGINFIAAHTNWDCAAGGINDTLAESLGLQDARPFGESSSQAQLKLVVFTPAESTRPIIDAASEAGAGKIGLYSRCAFLHPGTGTFFSNEGTDPTVGQVGEVTETPEVRIEMVLPFSRRTAVAEAVRSVHPYEEPALDFLRTTDFEEMPIGRVGDLPQSMAFEEFRLHVDNVLGTKACGWTCSREKRVRHVAVCGGAAADEWKAAKEAGADVLVTGEVPQHVALEVSENGFAIVAAGHYATEHPGCVRLAQVMGKRMPEVEWFVFEPVPGASGRPI